MADYVKYDQFVEDMGLELHDLDTDTLKFALTNTAPTPATDALLADITEIAGGNGYTAGGGTVANTAYSEVAGTATLTGDDHTFTAAGGAIAQFRYVVLLNSSHVGSPLICYWDKGSAVDVANGETFKVDLGASILTFA